MLPVKLPPGIVTLILPAMTTTAQTNFTNEIRVTEDSDTRITEDGEVRILDRYDAISYPEVIAIKLPANTISVSVPK